MCRHAILNKKGVNLIEKEYGGIENFIRFLIFERGGNGNGLALVKDGKLSFFYKDVNYSVEDICDKLKNFDYDYALFHTRLATVGSVSRSNCHPFVYSNKLLVSMNGTEDDYVFPRDIDKRVDMSDAERVIVDFFESGEVPEEYFLSGKFCSSFCGFYDGKPFALSNSKNLLRVLSNDDALIIASDFPWRYDGKNIYDLKNNYFYWDEEKGLPFEQLKESKHGRLNLLDALARQLFDKTLDTLITLLSQTCQISEEELLTFPVDTIIQMCIKYGIINNNDDVNKEHTR